MHAAVEDAIATTTGGAVRGSWSAGVAAFRGIPYAAPPTGTRRFAPPEAPTAWDGVRPALESGLASPQFAGRGDVAMGPLHVPGYGEDCLTLNVWTPSTDPAAKLPVLVWFHGGGLLFGSGSAEWYDGSVFARRGGFVVVTVTYRLGALGYLYLPPGARGADPSANRGLLDQCRALEWVQENIAQFGGNPDRVTAAGQSAGATSIIGLRALPRARGLFRRAILESGGLSMPARTPEAAAETTAAFLRCAGLAADDWVGLMELPVERIVRAQAQVLGELATTLGIDPRLKPMALVPFRLVLDGVVLSEDPVTAARQGSLDGGDLLLLSTAEEMRFAYAFDEAFWARSRADLVAEVQQVWGDDGVQLFEDYAAAQPGKPAPEVLCDMISAEGIGDTVEIAERRAAVGSPAYYAWFSWRSRAASGRLGACHTVELPFVFNNREHWADAPMLAGVDDGEFAALADKVQDAWIAFVTTGNPGPGWPPYTTPERAAMEFGARVGVLLDPAGGRRGFAGFLQADA